MVVEIDWQYKFLSVLGVLDDVFKEGNASLDLQDKHLYPLIPFVGSEIDDALSLASYEDDASAFEQPRTLHAWLTAGYSLENYPDWTPAQLMVAYGAYLVSDAEQMLDDAMPEDRCGQYNGFGFRRHESIEHCGAGVIAALECAHYGRLLINSEIVPDPEELAELMKQHASVRGRQGGKARGKLYDPIRRKAYQSARDKAPASGQWRSRRQAVLAIQAEVVEFSRTQGAVMSESQACITIDGWLKNMPEADILFAGKHGTSTGKDSAATGKRPTSE